ncbi:hypothetical protein Tco_1141551 [Tanacetum coccineum]
MASLMFFDSVQLTLNEEHFLDFRDRNLNWHVQVPLSDIVERVIYPIFTISDDVAKRAKNVKELNKRFSAIDDVPQQKYCSVVRQRRFVQLFEQLTLGVQSLLEQSTNKTKITRKPSKIGKHEYKNGRAQKKPGNQAKVKKSKLSVNYGSTKVNHKMAKSKVTILVPQVSKALTEVAQMSQSRIATLAIRVRSFGDLTDENHWKDPRDDMRGACGRTQGLEGSSSGYK